MLKSLNVLNHPFADPINQLEILENKDTPSIPSFNKVLHNLGMSPLKPYAPEVLQINIGKMCNQSCRHCHVDAGPDRKEIMDRTTMLLCLDAIRGGDFKAVDITGGAPELNPDFRWFVEQIRLIGIHVIVRCNLTIILANKKFHDLPQFFRANQVEVISSLPSFTADRTDRQRGEGVFESSIKALQMLNAAGYGLPETKLTLNLVYNPAGAFLPPDQRALENEYKAELLSRYGIEFNNLFVITNMPVSRYLDYLLSTGNYEKYMQKLQQAFNPSAIAGLMCRNTISVSWDGYLYDCDFNQMLNIKADLSLPHISEFSNSKVSGRSIKVGQHCYGCTAGAGSSCGGAIASV